MKHLSAVVVFVLGSGSLAGCRADILLEEELYGDGGDPGPATRTNASPVGAVTGATASGPGCPAQGGPGVPVAIATVPQMYQMVSDGTSLYVSAYEIGVVTSVSLEDCSTTTLNPIAASSVAINSNNVYTVSPNGGNEPQGLVVGCAKGGCGGSYQTIADGAGWGVAADDAFVYFTGGNPGSVMKTPVGGGGSVTTLVWGGMASNILVAGDRLVFVGNASYSGSGLLETVSTDGGTPTVLYTPAQDESVLDILSDTTNIYFSTTDGVIGQVPLAGGSATVLATGQGNGITGLAVDDANVYWAATAANFTNALLYKTPIGGGTVTTIAASLPLISAIVVDPTNLYLAASSGTVYKMAK